MASHNQLHFAFFFGTRHSTLHRRFRLRHTLLRPRMDGSACRATPRADALHDSTQSSSSASAFSAAGASSSPPFHAPALLLDRTAALASAQADLQPSKRNQPSNRPLIRKLAAGVRERERSGKHGKHVPGAREPLPRLLCHPAKAPAASRDWLPGRGQDDVAAAPSVQQVKSAHGRVR